MAHRLCAVQFKKGMRGSCFHRFVCPAIIDFIQHTMPSAQLLPHFPSPKRLLANPQASRLSFMHARASEQASYSTEPHPSHKCVLSRFCIPTLRRSELVLRRGQTHKGRGKSIVIVMSSIGFSYPDRTINWIQKKKNIKVVDLKWTPFTVPRETSSKQMPVPAPGRNSLSYQGPAKAARQL